MDDQSTKEKICGTPEGHFGFYLQPLQHISEAVVGGIAALRRHNEDGRGIITLRRDEIAVVDEAVQGQTDEDESVLLKLKTTKPITLSP